MSFFSGCWPNQNWCCSTGLVEPHLAPIDELAACGLGFFQERGEVGKEADVHGDGAGDEVTGRGDRRGIDDDIVVDGVSDACAA